MSQYDDLVRKLKEIFQIDRPELDFGVYRILNCRAAEINDYLENRLKAKVTESPDASDTAKDNRKDNDKEHGFVLFQPHTRLLTDHEGDEYEEELLPVAEEKGANGPELEYKTMPKDSKQETLALDAANKISDPIVKSRWLDLSMIA